MEQGARRLVLAVAVGLALAATGCSKDEAAERRDTTPRGGTLRVVVPRDATGISSTTPPLIPPLDPHLDFSEGASELVRCCLLRTLMSYPGRPTKDGGAELHPDLAVRMPRVSADGLTWTFEIKRGIRYGPPLEHVEVTAADFITALRRQAKLGDPIDNFAFVVIQGFEEYASGRSDGISGLETPDRDTLVIKLRRPSGDLGDLMTFKGTAPIPPAPNLSGSAFGVAQGHDDGYGRFLVATGPYMLEGSEDLEFADPPAQQRPLPSVVAGGTVVLVRNPSWRSATDDLRPAYVDRIEFQTRERQPEPAEAVTEGEADLVLDFRPPSPALRELATKVRADPSLGAVHVVDRDFVRYVSMNLATPPFDDVAVRRAVNLILDKATIQETLGGPFQGRVATHMALDSLEQNLLVAYDPYRTPEHKGDVTRAKQEMARSKYDRNRDGICDAPACRNIIGLIQKGRFPGAIPTFPKAGRDVADSLSRIGLDVRVEEMFATELFERLFDPKQKVHLGLAVGIGRGGGTLNPTGFFAQVFSKDSIGSFNHALLGATPEQLRSFGYDVSSVPAVDDRIEQCRGLTGDQHVRCWAAFDQYLMEEIVPWAPFSFETNVVIVSPRVVAFSWDQFAAQPALDRIAMRPGS
jgi:ABC-type transport system substrate-binding protein